MSGETPLQSPLKTPVTNDRHDACCGGFIRWKRIWAKRNSVGPMPEDEGTQRASPPPARQFMASSNGSLPAAIGNLRSKMALSLGELTRSFSARFQTESDRILTRIQEEGKLRVFVGTWNMYGRLPPEDLEPFILRPKSWAEDPEVRYHLVAIGTQECERSIEKSVIFPSKGLWEKQLCNYLGPRFVMVHAETMAAVHLAIFMLKELKPYMSSVQSGSVATGIGNVIGNKGGVGVGLSLNKTSLLFINSHFTAHQRRIAERNSDFHRINAEMPVRGPHSSTNVSDRFDYTFWFGDLNYRVNGTRKLVDNLIEKDMFEVLLANDQLTIERKKGNVFKGFQEAPITFPPTYKFDVPKNVRAISDDPLDDAEDASGTLVESVNASPTSEVGDSISQKSPTESQGLFSSPVSPVTPPSTRAPANVGNTSKTLARTKSVYDSSKKQRIQSWTDRILYKRRQTRAAAKKNALQIDTGVQTNRESSSEVRVLKYDSCMEMMWSDHKPVFACFELDFDWNRESPNEEAETRRTQLCSIM